MQESRSKITIKMAGVKRHLIWSALSGHFDMVLISEFPKSGASWLAQMLSEHYQIPFRRNESARFERCVMHGHYLIKGNFKQPIAVVRDGRDIMVSYYYHMLIGNDLMPSFSVKDARKRLLFDDYDAVKINMPAFIEYMFTEYPQRPGFMYFSWTQFVDSALLNDAIMVKYEDLKEQPEVELSRVIRSRSGVDADPKHVEEIVKKYSFKKLSGRSEGAENTASYLRKGIVGDWKNYFSGESKEVFEYYAGQYLIKLGYENDSGWVTG